MVPEIRNMAEDRGDVTPLYIILQIMYRYNLIKQQNYLDIYRYGVVNESGTMKK